LIRISFQLVLIRFVQKDQGGDYFYKKIWVYLLAFCPRKGICGVCHLNITCLLSLSSLNLKPKALSGPDSRGSHRIQLQSALGKLEAAQCENVFRSEENCRKLLFVCVLLPGMYKQQQQ
jgi:hypothetical protein